MTTTYAQNRQLGRVTIDGNVYARPAKIRRMVRGGSCAIGFTIQISQPGVWAIIDVDDLVPSHLGASQNAIHFIPEAQPRNRSASLSGVLTPEVIARNLRPAEVMNASTAYTGAPVINARGEVIQGNGRAYMLKVYYAQFPGDERGYQPTLQNEERCLGFGARVFIKIRQAGITQPVLVRLVAVPDERAIQLGQYTQADTEAIATKATQIKSKARQLTDDVLRRVLDELGDNPDETLSESIRNSKVLRVLVRDEILRTDDLENYTRSGQINDVGVEFVTALLLNALFRQADVNTSDKLTLLPVQLQNSVKKSVGYLLRCPDGRGLNAELAGCIGACYEFQTSGSSTFAGWLRQYNLSGKLPADNYTPLELAMANLFLEAKTQKEVMLKFRQYAELVKPSAGGLFGGKQPGLSKRDAARTVFGVELSEVVATPKRSFTVGQQPGQSPMMPGLKRPKSSNPAPVSTQTPKPAKAMDKKSKTTKAPKAAETPMTPAKPKRTFSPGKAAEPQMKPGQARPKPAKTLVPIDKDAKGKDFLLEVNSLTKKLHQKSKTGRTIVVPVYTKSISQAKKEALAIMKQARSTGKSIKNIKYKV